MDRPLAFTMADSLTPYQERENRRAAGEQALFSALKERLPELETLLIKVGTEWNYEEAVYRFYHQSFKVFRAQELTVEIVTALQSLLPGRDLNAWFMEIYRAGTGKVFHMDDNRNWLPQTRPIVEAFFHAKFFLEMAIKYGRELDAPAQILPTGWAAFLYLYDLR
jgi:hypothetical protein